MDEHLRAYLDRLREQGEAFDAREPDRLRRRRNLEPASANLVWILAVATNARRILEIGTSNGYSTLWLADAARSTGGHVTTVDVDAAAQHEAAGHIASNGLAGVVDFVTMDAGAHLAAAPTETVDLLFLDAERTEYAGWWPHPVRVPRPGGLLLVDNAVSHAEEIRPFVELLSRSGVMACQLLGLGKGMLVCVKDPGRLHDLPLVPANPRTRA